MEPHKLEYWLSSDILLRHFFSVYQTKNHPSNFGGKIVQYSVNEDFLLSLFGHG